MNKCLSKEIEAIAQEISAEPHAGWPNSLRMIADRVAELEAAQRAVAYLAQNGSWVAVPGRIVIEHGRAEELWEEIRRAWPGSE